jgi:phosphopantetheinyl transferase
MTVGSGWPDSADIFLAPLSRLGRAVVYAGVATEKESREGVVARLLAALAETAPEWSGALGWGLLTLEAGPLGQPRLRLGGRPGPGLSFSGAGGRLWVAVAAAGQVGVDAAREADFAPPYPYARAFGPREWDWAWRHCRGRAESAAALLWAAKEAAVKALGVGFHTLDPLDLEVAPGAPGEEGLELVVQASEPIRAWARALADGWLALAVA